MERAVATNFYTLKELSFQDTLGDEVRDIEMAIAGFSWISLLF